MIKKEEKSGNSRSVKFDSVSYYNEAEENLNPTREPEEIFKFHLDSCENTLHKVDDLLKNYQNEPNILTSYLPVINLFDDKEELEKEYPRIVDLGAEDKTRIRNLIDLIGKYKEKNEEDCKRMKKLETENSKLEKKVDSLLKEVSLLKEAHLEKDGNILELRNKQDKYLEDYRAKISELAKMKTEMESKNKFMDDRIQQMSDELTNLQTSLEQSSGQSKRIEYKYALAKSKLKQAFNIIKRRELMKECQTTNEKLHQMTGKGILDKEVNKAEEPERSKKNVSSQITAVQSELNDKRIKTIESQLLSDLFFSNQPSTCDNKPMFVIHTEPGL